MLHTPAAVEVVAPEVYVDSDAVVGAAVVGATIKTLG